MAGMPACLRACPVSWLAMLACVETPPACLPKEKASHHCLRLACMRASRIMKFVALVSSSTSRVPAPTSSASWMLAACSGGQQGSGGQQKGPGSKGSVTRSQGQTGQGQGQTGQGQGQGLRMAFGGLHVAGGQGGTSLPQPRHALTLRQRAEMHVHAPGRCCLRHLGCGSWWYPCQREGWQ